MAVNAANLMVTVGANTAMAEQGIMGLARLMGPGGMLWLGAGAAALAVVGVGAAATKMAGDFQTSMTQIVTGAGEQQKNLKLVSDGVLQLARDTGTSTKQLTDGLYMIESAGIHGADALKVLQAAAEGAKVGNADLGSTADALTTIMKDFPGVTDGATGAMNTLIATVASGKTHMQDLAGALSSILPTAEAAGVGLNDVMAAMAAQTAAGVPAADAATHLRQLLIALTAPSAAAKKAMQEVGLSSDEVAAAMKKSLPDALAMIQQHLAETYGVGTPKYMEAMKNISGGMREMQGMLLLTSQTGMKDFKNDLTSITGQVQQGGQQIQGWNLVQGTFNQQMDRLGEIFQTLMITLGEHLLPIATDVAKFLADTLEPAFGNVAQAGQAVGAVANNLIAPLSGLGLTARNLSEPVKETSAQAHNLHQALSGIAQPIQQTGEAARALAKTFTDVSHPVQQTNATLQQFKQWLGGLDFTYLNAAIWQMQQAWSAASKTMNNDALPILKQLELFFQNDLLPAVTQFATFAATTLIPMFAEVSGFINKNVIPVLIQLAGWFVQNVLPAVESLVEFFRKNVLPILETFWQVIAKNVIPVVENVAHTILTKWLPPLERIMSDVLPVLNPLLQALGWLFQNVIGPVLGMAADNVGKLLSGVADLADGISKFVKNPSVQNLVTLMENIAGAGQKVGAAISPVGFLQGHLPHFASGGVMGQTGPALVGENGPEIVTLPGGAQVTPFNQIGGLGSVPGLAPLSGGMSANASGQPLQVNLYVNGQRLAAAQLPHIVAQIRTQTGRRNF